MRIVTRRPGARPASSCWRESRCARRTAFRRSAVASARAASGKPNSLSVSRVSPPAPTVSAIPRPWSPPAACDHDRSVSSLVSRLSRRHSDPSRALCAPGTGSRVAGGAPATLGDFERVGFRVARGLPGAAAFARRRAPPPPPPPPSPSPRQSSRRSCRAAPPSRRRPRSPPVAPFGSEGTFASLPPRSTRSARTRRRRPPPTAPPPPAARARARAPARHRGGFGRRGCGGPRARRCRGRRRARATEAPFDQLLRRARRRRHPR